MKIKRPVDQPGTTRRISMSFTESTYEALRDQSAKSGYSIAGVARQLIDRAVAAGLLSAETPSSKVEDLVKMYRFERLVETYEELRLEMQLNIDLLLRKIDIYERRNGQMQQKFEEYAETITEQARDIQFYEQARVADAPDPAGEPDPAGAPDPADAPAPGGAPDPGGAPEPVGAR